MEKEKLHADIKVDFDKFDLNKVTRVDLFEKNTGYVLYDLFSKEECNRIIAACEKVGFDKLNSSLKGFRDNNRIISESKTLIKELDKRIKHFIEPEIIINENAKTIVTTSLMNGKWKYDHLNERIRLCRYKETNKFKKHYDSGYHPDPFTERTIKTCMVYLNDNFDGGHTRFYEETYDDDKLIHSLKPVQGMCIIFNQYRLHDGEEVTKGKKYIMRTDMIYKAHELENKPEDKHIQALELFKEGETLELKFNNIYNIIKEKEDLIKKLQNEIEDLNEKGHSINHEISIYFEKARSLYDRVDELNG